MKTRPSPWFLGPALTAFSLFAYAHRDVLFMGLCAIAILMAYIHTTHIELPNRAYWFSTLSLITIAGMLCVIYYGTVLGSSATLVQPSATLCPSWLLSTAGLMLGLVVVWLWHLPNAGSRKTGPLMACIGLLMVAGCHRLSSSFFGLNLLALCGGAVVLTLFACGGSLRHTRPRSFGTQLRQSFVILGCIALIGAGTVTLSMGLRRLGGFFERMGADNTPGRQYTGALGVGDSLTLQRRQRIHLSRRIVATLNGTHAPRYLRTRVLTRYHKQRWSAASHPSQSLTAEIERRRLPQPHVATAAQRWYDMPNDATNQAAHTVPPQVTPGDNQMVELRMNLLGAVPLPYTARRVSLPTTLHCIALPSELFNCTPVERLTTYTYEHAASASVPYGVGQALHAQTQATLGPDRSKTPAISQTLDIPKDIVTSLHPLALQIAGAEPASAMAAAQRIQTYFRRHYTYALEVNLAQRGDPAVDFVLNRRPAYCQYFASGMVLLLRTLGMPARLVSGFVVWEFNALTSQWIVRQRDAHAWVEVYDASSNRWVAFDPTPPHAAPHVNSHHMWPWRLAPAFTWLELRLSSAIATLQHVLSGDRWAPIQSIRPIWMLQPVYFIALGCMASGLALWLRGWRGLAVQYRQWQRKRQTLRLPLSPERAEAHQHFKQIATALHRQGIGIDSAETMEAYLHRITAYDMDAQPLEMQALMPLLNDFTRHYMALRFGLQTADPAAIGTQVGALRDATEHVMAALSHRRSERHHLSA